MRRKKPVYPGESVATEAGTVARLFSWVGEDGDVIEEAIIIEKEEMRPL